MAFSFSRRDFLQSLGVGVAGSVLSPVVGAAQTPESSFDFEGLVVRARDMAKAAHQPPLWRGSDVKMQSSLARMDFDAWRDIRFRAEKAVPVRPESPFRLQLFHPGFLYTVPVNVNVMKAGTAVPIPYQPSLFDYGRNTFEKPLGIDTGFAGFRVHYPLNKPRVFDELISFLGASYFRVLGRHQRYGLSARGLAIGVGEAEQFPLFREFWVEQPQSAAQRVDVYALLDSEAVTGAYRFAVYPMEETRVEVTAHLFFRQRVTKLGLAPLTSMYLSGENEPSLRRDYRAEAHDSDGLLMHTRAGEWLWRPLRNPSQTSIVSFFDKDVRGFGLMQRDRTFEHYQDLDLHYESRPGYWIEPLESWGEGRVELMEIPTADETNDNIVASWVPQRAFEPGQDLRLSYRLTSVTRAENLQPGGYTVNTFQTVAKALGSPEAPPPGSRRFIIDFAGGDLSYFLQDPEGVHLHVTTGQGRLLSTFVVPNPHIQGFRAALDVTGEPGQALDLRAYLRQGQRALTETWTYLWAVPVN